MRFHRIVGLLVATAAAVIMAPAAAHAAPYPAEPPDSSVSDGTVSDGATVTFSGEGFLPRERISVQVRYGGSDSSAALRQKPAGGFVLAAMELPRRAGFMASANAGGEFSVRVNLTQAGYATLIATGLTSGVTVTENVHVLATSAGDNGGNGTSGDNNGALPTTGPSGAPLLIALSGGTGAVLLGAAFLWFARSRRRNTVRSR